MVAANWVNPTTFGTATPVETVRSTADLGSTWVLAAGDWLMTFPMGTVELGAEVTTPMVKPALVIEVPAAACVKPTTSGTCEGERH